MCVLLALYEMMALIVKFSFIYIISCSYSLSYYPLLFYLPYPTGTLVLVPLPLYFHLWWLRRGKVLKMEACEVICTLSMKMFKCLGGGERTHSLSKALRLADETWPLSAGTRTTSEGGKNSTPSIERQLFWPIEGKIRLDKCTVAVGSRKLKEFIQTKGTWYCPASHFQTLFILNFIWTYHKDMFYYKPHTSWGDGSVDKVIVMLEKEFKFTSLTPT